MIINLINYFSCNLYCFIIMLCTVFDFGDCSIDSYSFVLYCVVCFFFFLCYVFFMTSFMLNVV